MNSLLSRALELQRMAHELMYLDTNGSPIYSDEFCRLNKEVLTRSDSLFSEQSSDIEEEGNLCLALLMGIMPLSMIMEIRSGKNRLFWIVSTIL